MHIERHDGRLSRADQGNGTALPDWVSDTALRQVETRHFACRKNQQRSASPDMSQCLARCGDITGATLTHAEIIDGDDQIANSRNRCKSGRRDDLQVRSAGGDGRNGSEPVDTPKGMIGGNDHGTRGGNAFVFALSNVE